MRRADVPTQRRPRQRQVSQGMREGKGRTAADATSVGVGAIEVLHPSPGHSIADPKPNKQNRMQTQTPQPNNPSPTAIPDVRGRVPVGATGGSPSPELGDGLPMVLRGIPSLPPSTKLEQRLALFSSPPEYKLEGRACAPRTHVPLFTPPPLLEGPKGEGDRGGEGSPPFSAL